MPRGRPKGSKNKPKTPAVVTVVAPVVVEKPKPVKPEKLFEFVPKKNPGVVVFNTFDPVSSVRLGKMLIRKYGYKNPSEPMLDKKGMYSFTIEEP